jgi:signal transduction histidine kinase
MLATIVLGRAGRIVQRGWSVYSRWGMSRSTGDATFAYAMHERHLTILDAAVPAVVGAVIVVGETLHGGASTRPVSLVLGVAAALALAGRRRWSGWTLATSGLLVAVLFHLDRTAASVAVLAPAVALYSVALRRGRLEQAAAGIVAVAAVVAADVAHPGQPTLGQTIGHALLVAVPLLAAEVIRTHRANVRLLVEQLELAEQARGKDAEHRAEQERMRIARELHDVVAHTLTEINVTAAAAAEQAGEGDERTALEHIERSSHDAIGELRAILGVLRGPGTAPHAPTPGIDDIGDMITRARTAGIDVHLDIEGPPPDRISDAISLTTYRIVQESLTNVRRHASGAQAGVRLRFGPLGVTVTVDSDGATGASTDGAGVGITGMRERVIAVGGQLSAGPHDSGFRVHADLPYEQTE